MSNGLLALLTAGWLTASAAGMGVLLVHDFTPGTDTSVASHWPKESAIPLSKDRSTLVMFAHPDCPCTRASVDELAILMARCPHEINAHVVFLQPAGTGDNWLHTDLWESAKAIPGVTVEADRNGEEMKRFHVTTSGHVLLYDEKGNLLFSGGITPSRGHEGDNAGIASIMQLLRGEIAVAVETPAFGCSLLNPASEDKKISAWIR